MRRWSSSEKNPASPEERAYRSAPTTPVSQSSSETRNENTMIAIATHSDALTTMPATLAARCPGRWRTCASASEAIGEFAGSTRRSTARQSGATASTDAASHAVMAP